MRKTLLIISFLACLALAHKGTKPHDQTINSIYQPFTDVPKPIEQEPLVEKDAAEVISNDEKEVPADRQEQYEEFNEMLKYGLVIGTLLLSFMLIKTCSLKGSRHRRMLPMAIAQEQMIRAPILNNSPSAELKNKIHWHQSEIRRLEQECKQMQEAEKKAMEESMRQARRCEEMRVCSSPVEMQEAIPISFHSQQAPYQYQYYNNIPMGRPLARDNDSSFASEYPMIYV